MTAPGPSDGDPPGNPRDDRSDGNPRRLTFTTTGLVAAALALALAAASLAPARDRTWLIGRPGDAQAVERFYPSSTHLGMLGRWTRGDGLVSLPRVPLPAVLSLRVAAPDSRGPDSRAPDARAPDARVADAQDARASDAIDLVLDDGPVSQHELARGWNAIDLPVDAHAAAPVAPASPAIRPPTGPPMGPQFRPQLRPQILWTPQLPIRLHIRSAVTPSPEGRPLGLFVERVTLRTGGLDALRRTPAATWLSLTLACLAVIVVARRLGYAGLVLVPLAWAALVGFRTEILTRLPIVAALSWAAAAFVLAAGAPRVTRAFAALSPARAVVVFSGGGLLLIGLLLPEAWWHGHVLSQADMFFEYFPWRAHVPADYRPPERAPLGDIPMMVYPFLAFAQARWQEGIFPLWTNAMNAGQPFLGTFQSALLAPLTWIAAVVPLPQATVWIAALRLLVGGTGLFAYLRAIGLSRWAAAFGGVTYLLNPYSVVWLEHPPGGVPPWLPWMLLAGERVGAIGSSWASVGLLALTTALVLTGGHPHTALFVAVLGGSYALLRAWTSAPHGLASTSRVLTALALGIALSAAQVLPFLEYLSLSHGAIWRNEFPLNPFIAPASTLITAIVPNFLGHHGDGNYAGPTNYLEQQIYPGIATWILAIVGLACGARRWRVWFFAGAALGAMLVMYGAPGVHQLVSILPLVKAASLPRIAIVTLASLAVLAAHGVDDLLRADRRSRTTWIATGAILVSAATLTVLARHALHARHDFLDAHGLVAFATQWTWLTLGLVVTTMAIALAWLWRLTDRSTTAAALVMVAACDLLVFGRGFRPLIPPSQVYPTVPEIAIVRQDPGLFRVMGAGGALMPNAAMVYGLQDVRGYDGLTVARYAELLQAAFTYEYQVHSIVTLQVPLINLLNVKYVFGVPNIPAPEGWFTKLTDGEAPLYLNTRAFPRTFLVDGYDIQTGNAARRTLRDGRVDLRRIALLEQDPPPAERPVAAPSPDRVGTTRVTHYRDHDVQIDTDAPERRLLVLTDVHYPGWTASVDGRPVTIHRANFAFRAVSVPAGRHTVRFTYRPASFRIGLAISTTAAALLLGLAFSPRRPPPRPPPPIR